MKTYSVTLDEAVVKKAQELNSDEKLSPLLNKLLDSWNKSHRYSSKQESTGKKKAKPKPKEDIDIMGDDIKMGDINLDGDVE
jgi:hypothetical protein